MLAIGIFVRDSIELVVDQSGQIVKQCYYKLCFVVISVAEFGLRLIAFLSTNESDGRELLKQAFALLFANTILKVVLVKQVIGYLCNVRMTAILRPKQDRGLTLVLKSNEQRYVWRHNLNCTFAFVCF